MQLISELIEVARPVIEESADGKKSMFLEGIYMQDSVKNRNGRMYPKKVMKETVQKYIEDFVSTKRAMGELNHPASPQVNPERASHLVVSLKEDGTNWIGRAKILSTPMGKLVENLISDGVQMGVSSRGLGAVKESEGVNVVQNGFILTAIDVVSDPSAPDAFVNGIMEGKEWIVENGILVEKQIEEIQTTVNKTVRAGNFTEEFLEQLFNKIVTKI